MSDNLDRIKQCVAVASQTQSNQVLDDLQWCIGEVERLKGEVKQFKERIEYVLAVSLSIRPDDALWVEILRLQAELRQLQQKGGV